MNIKQHGVNQVLTKCLCILFIIMLMGTTIFIIYNNSNPIVAYDVTNYDEVYYVSANGDDITGIGSQTNPWATLTKTTAAITGTDKNYLIYVMTDLNMTAGARYYDNSITITSLGNTPCKVTRTAGFPLLPEFVGGVTRYYNPAMIELESSYLVGDHISLTIGNIIFDDAYLHEGSVFNYRTATATATFVQDAIVSSHSPIATIILDEGVELRSFGGMTAAHAADGATLKMNAGSLITDINSTTATRQVSATGTDYRAVGDAAVSIATGSHFYMYDGAKITNIANAHSVKLSGNYKCFIDGEITGMKGNKGWDATDHSTSPTHEGRGFKCAVLFNGGHTLNPDTGNLGSAIIGPNANIHHNAVKCGAIGVSRSVDISIEIYGKINDNAGQKGSSWQTIPIIGSIALDYGTNGGGIYIVSGGTVYLEKGSEVCRNSVINMAYGSGINIQQSGSKLVMNGGLVQGNTAAGMGPGIAVNKGTASFEMNDGVVDNGPNGVLLFNNRVSMGTAVKEDNDCNGQLILNGGLVSGVTVNSLVAYGTNTAGQNRSLYISENVHVDTGYVAVAGAMQSTTSTTNVPRQVKLLPVNSFDSINIGNPNKALYPIINTALPKNWTMPSTADNVIAFWMKKDGIAEFSVPAPLSGSGGANYNVSLKYFAAVLKTNVAGAADESVIKLYPTEIKSGQIVVSVPLNEYSNGALVALVQPTSAYGEIIFDAPLTLTYTVGASNYAIPYTGKYDASLLLDELITDGYTEANTLATLTIHPDPNTIPDVSSFVISSSDIFELAGIVTWDSANWILVVPVKLTSGWDLPTADPVTTFKFDCTLNAADFVNDYIISLTGELEIKGTHRPSSCYHINGNYAKTELKIPEGSLKITKTIAGNATSAQEEFHFTVTFSDGGTYDGIVSDAMGAITLKGGEQYVIIGIPHGVNYIVTEVEANQNGYTTFSTGANGAILSNTQSEANFLNTKYNIIQAEYTVMYNGNGHNSGLAPVDINSPYESGSQVTVLGQNSLVKTGYSFLGWSQSSTSNIATYTPGSTFIIYNDVVLYAVWVKNVYTVTYQPGTHGTFNTQTTSGLHYGDPTPTAPVVTGQTGWTFIGWLPAPFATVTSNIIYIAQWSQATTSPPVIPTPSLTPSPTPSLTPSPTPSLTPSPTPSLAPTSKPSLAPTSKPTLTPIPTLTASPSLTLTPTVSPPIGDDENVSRQVWAFVNLVLSIVGIILAILITLYALLQRKQKNKQQQQQQLQKKQYDKPENIGGQQAGKYDPEQDTEKKQNKHKRIWLAISIIAGIAGIILFLLTEDMNRAMVMIDKWTIVNVIIFLAEIIAITLTFKRKKDTTNNKEQEQSNTI